ncbi:hypothetical protein [Burkholderia gladioli]|uniref:hypothetical protein n=1 Tax=Burkholderia gladioli TaxID=28095 RepID=UPI00164077F7|nr:hypothetical protein [Burkholderia gladioli]
MTSIDSTHAGENAPEGSLGAARRPPQVPAANDEEPNQVIFVVQAVTMYEGSDPVRAFATREAAESFAQRCHDHEDARRDPPRVDAPDEEWQAWSEANHQWELSHPAEPFSRRETYAVMPLAFDPS